MIRCLCIFALVAVAAADPLYHDVNIVERHIHTNCTDTQMNILIDDPEFKITNDTHTSGGEIYVVWYVGTTRQTYRYQTNGDTSTSDVVCTGGVNLVSDGNGGGTVLLTFTDGAAADLCGATVVGTNIDDDAATDEVFEWTGPIITLRYNTEISLKQDIHVFSTCTYNTKATVSSVDIGAAGREPILITDVGSLYADLTLRVFKVVESLDGNYVQFDEIMDGELVAVGMPLAAIIDLERNNPNDDVGIKHFSCWAVDPVSVNQVNYGLIADGCPDIGLDNTHIGDDVNVRIELSSGVTRLMFYYNQFALGSLYRLYCTVEFCQPSLAGDCDNVPCAKRKKRQATNLGSGNYETLNRTLYVYMEQDGSIIPTGQPIDGGSQEADPQAEKSCATSPEFIAPLCILAALLIILLIVCACMLRKLHRKDEEIEKFTYMSSTASPAYPASSYKA